MHQAIIRDELNTIVCSTFDLLHKIHFSIWRTWTKSGNEKKTEQSLLQNEKHVRFSLVLRVSRSSRAAASSNTNKSARSKIDKEPRVGCMWMMVNGGCETGECIFQARHSWPMCMCAVCRSTSHTDTSGTEIAWYIRIYCFYGLLNNYAAHLCTM